MIEVETAHYIKGMHNLMGAHFDLRNHNKLVETIQQFEKFSHRKMVEQNDKQPYPDLRLPAHFQDQ